ncbi:MAG TPA: hypothetical protein VGQ32_09410, partial [Thermoanaerobaculia bacterium]|nr:hypothetical protein [Thermoanaerobaculia bacterium]
MRNAPIRLPKIARRNPTARLLVFAGLLLVLFGGGEARAAERLRIAAERADGRCVGGGKILVLARLEAAPSQDEPAASCVFAVSLPDDTDARIEEASSRLTALH